jgi:integrase
MASIHPRESRDGKITYQVRFRLGGGRGGKVQTEVFHEAEQAAEFKDLVDEAGQQWPAGWIRGRGFIAADEGETSYRFRDFALAAMGERTGIEKRTRRDNLRLLETWIFPTFGECDVTSSVHFSRSTIRQWIRVLEETLVTQGPTATKGPARAVPKPMSKSTIHKLFWQLSAILDEAVHHEPPLRERNPCELVTLPREDDETEDDMEFLEPHEIAALLDACFEHRNDELLVVIKYGTGLRWGEITALQPQDVIGLHTARPRLRVQRAWKKDEAGRFYLGAPKSKKSRRTIRISRTVVAALVELGVGRKPREQLLFTGGDGKSKLAYSTFSARWWRAVRLAQERGLEKAPTPHDLRHSHAAALISAGHPLTYVQRRLGHASIQITSDTYGHLLPEADADAMDTIETSFTGQRPALRDVS